MPSPRVRDDLGLFLSMGLEPFRGYFGILLTPISDESLNKYGRYSILVS